MSCWMKRRRGWKNWFCRKSLSRCCWMRLIICCKKSSQSSETENKDLNFRWESSMWDFKTTKAQKKSRLSSTLQEPTWRSSKRRKMRWWKLTQSPQALLKTPSTLNKRHPRDPSKTGMTCILTTNLIWISTWLSARNCLKLWKQLRGRRRKLSIILIISRETGQSLNSSRTDSETISPNKRSLKTVQIENS